MSERSPKTYEAEARETIYKSGLTGVAATMLAVAAFSPAGFGGMIGTSLASGFGMEPSANNADNVYAQLPAYPRPITEAELIDIQGDLARTSVSLEITRAATEAKLEQLRAIASSEGVEAFAPLAAVTQLQAPIGPDLRVTASVVETFDAPEEMMMEPLPPPEPGSHLELAELLFAHENL